MLGPGVLRLGVANLLELPLRAHGGAVDPIQLAVVPCHGSVHRHLPHEHKLAGGGDGRQADDGHELEPRVRVERVEQDGGGGRDEPDQVGDEQRHLEPLDGEGHQGQVRESVGGHVLHGLLDLHATLREREHVHPAHDVEQQPDTQPDGGGVAGGFPVA